MGRTFLCALELFLLNIFLYFGHAQDLMLTFEPNWSTFFTQESVIFVCDMTGGRDTDWYYTILKNGHEFVSTNTNKNYTVQLQSKSDSGEYECFGRYKFSHLTRQSNKVSLTVSDHDVILEHPASVLYEGESVTLRCRRRTQRKQKTAAFYKNGSLIEMDAKQPSNNTANITIQLTGGGSYKCKFEDEESEPIKLKVESNPPKAQLREDSLVRGKVNLTCSVNSPSSGWKYFWYKGNKSLKPLTTEDVVFLSNEKISVSWGGPYWCRGGRGDPLYYTEYSDAVVRNRAVVTLQPSWPEIYQGETITLRCDIEDGGDTDWEYHWSLPRSYKSQTHNQYMITYVMPSHVGSYMCFGRIKSGMSTHWSNTLELKISDKEPVPVLTVSPLWLSSGDSVTLKCDVERPSEGWRFYWYQAVPKLSGSYGHELLPGNTNGTAQDAYIVHRQTNTACYACRAGRGDPVYFSLFSELKCVWSGDFHPAASLTVTPDRVQHFVEESVSLRCRGNSTQWRVRRLSEYGLWTTCTSWGTMTGSTCNMSQSIDGVYWCESETGQFSNAVNISGQYNIIMMSPAHPVAEGRSLTLGCKLKTENDLSVVDFYKNGELIQNDTRRELTIPAASKSDEGFYSCKGQDAQRGWQSWTSKESWVSVKSMPRPQGSPFPVLLTVGLVCGVLLTLLLLLLLYHYTNSKDSCFIRSQSTNQDTIGRSENQCKEHAPPLSAGDACLYEVIKNPEDAENDQSSDVTYSAIELKNIAKKGKNNEPEESAVYSNVKIGSASDPKDTFHSTPGKSSPAAADETVYSEVKRGAALDH